MHIVHIAQYQMLELPFSGNPRPSNDFNDINNSKKLTRMSTDFEVTNDQHYMSVLMQFG